jgi:hypothetical protein
MYLIHRAINNINIMNDFYWSNQIIYSLVPGQILKCKTLSQTEGMTSEEVTCL